MQRDAIARIEIDEQRRLHLMLSSATFPYMWRGPWKFIGTQSAVHSTLRRLAVGRTHVGLTTF